MKLKLDLEAKTIQIEEDINLGKLINDLNKILPNNEWHEYKLIYAPITVWSSPVIIERERYYPNYPWILPNVYPSFYGHEVICNDSLVISDNNLSSSTNANNILNSTPFEGNIGSNGITTSYCIEMQ